MLSQITRFACCGNGGFSSTPRSGAASSTLGGASDASATAPTPCAERPRKARRAIQLCCCIVNPFMSLMLMAS